MESFDLEKSMILNSDIEKIRIPHTDIPLELRKGKLYSIGRSRNCDVVIPHRRVSGHHADIKITERPGQKTHFVVYDRNSETGVYIGGDRVRESVVKPLDQFQISIYTLQLFKKDDIYYVRYFENEAQYRIEAMQVSFSAGGKKILEDVNIVVYPGEFVGLFGPSGSGKTTLLKLLSGYCYPNFGEVHIGGVNLHKNFDLLKERVGYVPQDDIIFRDLTVQESLLYSARLRLPQGTSHEELMAAVNETVDQLDIKHIIHQPVSSLSGGQRKRVSIGVELLTRPKILIMDEPDSGLDPHIQDQLMEEFKNLAESGASVIMTTHTLDNFNKFKYVAIISMGKLVYYGPPQDALHFFNTGENDVKEPRHIFRKLDSRDESDPKYRVDLAKRYAEEFQTSSIYSRLITERQTAPTFSYRPSEGDQQYGFNNGWETLFLRLVKAFFSKSTFLNICKPHRFFTKFEFARFFTLVNRHIHLRFANLRTVSLYLIIPFVVMFILSFQKTIPSNEIAEMAEVQMMYCKNIEKLKNHESKDGRDNLKQSSISIGSDHNGIEDLENGIDKAQAGKEPSSEYILNHQPRLDMDANRMLLKPQIPHIFPLTLVLTAIFCGIFISTSEISEEWSIYKREHLVCIDIGAYLISKIPLLFGITFIQMSILFSLTVILKDIRGIPYFQGLVTLVLVAWASVCLGLLLSSIDKSGRTAIILSIVFIVPQIIWSGAIAPNFYEKMHEIPRVISSAFVSRWGFEGLARVFNDTSIVEWGAKLVEYQLGFPPRAEIMKDPLFWVHLPMVIICAVLFVLTWISLKIQDILG